MEPIPGGRRFGAVEGWVLGELKRASGSNMRWPAPRRSFGPAALIPPYYVVILSHRGRSAFAEVPCVTTNPASIANPASIDCRRVRALRLRAGRSTRRRGKDVRRRADE